jgi:hypothetical protein
MSYFTAHGRSTSPNAAGRICQGLLTKVPGRNSRESIPNIPDDAKGASGLGFEHPALCGFTYIPMDVFMYRLPSSHDCSWVQIDIQASALAYEFSLLLSDLLSHPKSRFSVAKGI